MFFMNWIPIIFLAIFYHKRKTFQLFFQVIAFGECQNKEESNSQHTSWTHIFFQAFSSWYFALPKTQFKVFFFFFIFLAIHLYLYLFIIWRLSSVSFLWWVRDDMELLDALRLLSHTIDMFENTTMSERRKCIDFIISSSCVCMSRAS